MLKNRQFDEEQCWEYQIYSIQRSLIINRYNIMQADSKAFFQDQDQQSKTLPKSYLDLIEKVGGNGKYQLIATLVFSLAWYATGIILMSSAFIFLNSSFDCQAQGLLTENCYEYVCALKKQQWPQFISADSKNFKSLANQFDNYLCSDEVFLNLYTTFPYFGALIGYIFVSFFADNYGRKNVAVVAWGINCVGCLVLMFSQTIWMAAIGLALCGLGSDSVLGITSSCIAQQYNDRVRQKHFTLVQGAFTAGSLFVTLIYYLWEDWFITVTYCLFIPSVLTELCLILFIKQSPLYLIRKGPQHALKELNQIGKINTGNPQILNMDDIKSVMEYQQTDQFLQVCTPIDVFKYPSLRLATFTQAIVSLSTYLMYYGPTLIVSQFGFDIYTSTVVLNVADLLTYYPLMLIVDKIRRKKALIIQFLVATVISGIMIFLVKPEDCDSCIILYVQLVLIFIFRFAISMEFALMNVYQTELYPTRIRNIAGGVLGVFGTIASTTSPLIMGAITRAQLNPFILFTVMGLLAMGAYTFSPETYGKLCPQQIEQIAYLKLKRSETRNSIKNEIKQHKS